MTRASLEPGTSSSSPWLIDHSSGSSGSVHRKNYLRPDPLFKTLGIKNLLKHALCSVTFWKMQAPLGYSGSWSKTRNSEDTGTLRTLERSVKIRKRGLIHAKEDVKRESRKTLRTGLQCMRHSAPSSYSVGVFGGGAF